MSGFVFQEGTMGEEVQGMYLVISPNPEKGFATEVNTNKIYFNFKVGDGGVDNRKRYRTDNKDSLFTTNEYDYTDQDLGDGSRGPGKALELIMLTRNGYRATPGEDGEMNDSTEWHRVYAPGGQDGSTFALYLRGLAQVFRTTNFCDQAQFDKFVVEAFLGGVSNN